MTDYLIEFGSELLLATDEAPGEDPSHRIGWYAGKMNEEKNFTKEEES